MCRGFENSGKCFVDKVVACKRSLAGRKETKKKTAIKTSIKIILRNVQFP